VSGNNVPGLREFLQEFPRMAVRPSSGTDLVLKGRFAFSAVSDKHGEITDEYLLAIDVPRDFPKSLPRITETAGKIPREEGFHINPDDTLCLGSPLRLLLNTSTAPTLLGFAEKCLIPHLFAISHKLRHGGSLPFGELAHGLPGILIDYMDLFKLEKPEQAFRALQLLGLKKRRANKHACPCGCKRRLGKCQFNFRMRKFRELSKRAWFRQQAQEAERHLEIYRRRLSQKRPSS
jgi:hypothetical protein